jgi:hypothetical protein
MMLSMRPHIARNFNNSRKAVMGLAGVLALSGLTQQSPAQSAPAPKFDVASIKPSGPGDAEHCAGGRPSPGRVTITCSTL